MQIELKSMAWMNLSLPIPVTLTTLHSLRCFNASLWTTDLMIPILVWQVSSLVYVIWMLGTKVWSGKKKMCAAPLPLVEGVPAYNQVRIWPKRTCVSETCVEAIVFPNNSVPLRNVCILLEVRLACKWNHKYQQYFGAFMASCGSLTSNGCLCCAISKPCNW